MQLDDWKKDIFFLYYSFGQYLASTLPDDISEEGVSLDKNYSEDAELHALQTTINQRNTLLDVLIHLLLETCENGKINVQ